MMNSHDITSWFASMALKRKMSPFVERYLGRPFSKKSAQHVLIGYYPLDISWVQIYPFLHYAPQLLDTYNVEIRCVPVGHILEGQPLPCGAPDVLLFQPWFTTGKNSLAQRLEEILQRHPQVKISFVDSFAHTDIRLADIVDPYIEFYLKKSLFKDQNNYLRGYRGDTNLTEYYGDLFQLDQPMVNWNTPETILPKLRLSPNFHLAPKFLRPI
ncbi:MAG: glycosyltransferase family 1 protein, partial [Pseudomonadota bacterium]